MSLPATDAFTGTNGTQLTAYSSNWTKLTASDPDIQTNAIAPDAATEDQLCYWNADTAADDQYTQIKIVALGGGGSSIGPAVRASTSQITAYFVYYGSTGALELWKVVNNSYTQINNTTRTLSANDVVRLEAEGSTITVKVNGSIVSFGAQTDSSITSGRLAVHGYDDDPLHRGDDWEGGEFGVFAATGFPVIAGTVTPTSGTGATTTPVVNMPSGVVAGETLCVLIRVAAAGAIGWPDGTWNELFDVATDASDDQMAMAWRKADGTEGADITLSSANGKFAALAWRVAGATDPSVRAPEISTIATGTSTTPDPSAVTPTGGKKNYLWGWVGGWEGEQTSPPASNPTDYALSVTGASSGTAAGVTTNCRVAVAFRQINASSQDPGSWTISVSDDWTAYAIAFHPADLPPVVRVVRDAVNRAASW